LCNVGITDRNLYRCEEENETDMMITENLHVRVAETCVNWQKENFRVHNRIMT